MCVQQVSLSAAVLFTCRSWLLTAICLVMQIASCERTHLPTGREADKVKSILKEQALSEAAMHVFRKGSQTGSRPVHKSFGKPPLQLTCWVMHHSNIVSAERLTSTVEHQTSLS